MPRTVVLDEWHLTFHIRSNLPAPTVRSIRRTLNGKTFTTAVRRAVVAEMRKRPAMKPVRVVLGR